MYGSSEKILILVTHTSLYCILWVQFVSDISCALSMLMICAFVLLNRLVEIRDFCNVSLFCLTSFSFQQQTFCIKMSSLRQTDDTTLELTEQLLLSILVNEFS